MLAKITKNITDQIVKNVPGTTPEKAEQIEYGLYVAIADNLKLIAVLLTAFALGQFKYALVAVLLFAINKSYWGGVHAKTQWGCVITHFSLIFSTVYLSQVINIKHLNIILYIISGILVFLYAPADLTSKPIISIKRKKELRAKGIIIVCVSFISTFLIPTTYSNIISIITLISAINLTPIMYKVTKNKKGGIC